MTEKQIITTIADMLRRNNVLKAISFAKSVVRDPKTSRKVSQLLSRHSNMRITIKTR